MRHLCPETTHVSISERTRKALAVKRLQDVQLERPSALSVEIVSRIVPERTAGQSLRAIADWLARYGVATAQGGQSWYASTVSEILANQQPAQLDAGKEINDDAER